MNDWLKLMLEEIRRKQREQEEALQERRRRDEHAERDSDRPAAQRPDEPRGQK